MKPTTPEEEPGNGLSGDTRGRRPKLTPQVHRTMETLFQAAATVPAACQAVGIDPGTFKNWMTWGEQARRGVYRDFFKEMTIAMGMGRVMVETKIAVEKPLDYAKHVYRKTVEWAPLQEKLEITADVSIDVELGSTLAALVDAEVQKRKEKDGWPRHPGTHP